MEHEYEPQTGPLSESILRLTQAGQRATFYAPPRLPAGVVLPEGVPVLGIAYEAYEYGGVTQCAPKNLAACFYVDSFPLAEYELDDGEDDA